MKKLLLIGNPSVLGKNLENILKQNYNTDFISAVPKQIGSIPFNSYNALILDFTLLHNYSLTICKAAKKTSPILLFCFYALPIFQNKLFWISMNPMPMTIYILPSHYQHSY